MHNDFGRGVRDENIKLSPVFDIFCIVKDNRIIAVNINNYRFQH